MCSGRANVDSTSPDFTAVLLSTTLYLFPYPFHSCMTLNRLPNLSGLYGVGRTDPPTDHFKCEKCKIEVTLAAKEICKSTER